MTRGRRLMAAACLMAAVSAAGLVSPAVAAVPSRVDLRVLVVDDGAGPAAAIADQLWRESVPTRVVDLRAANRPVLDTAFLADLAASPQRSYFQAVVLPNEAPSGLTQAELDAVHDIEARFGLRQVDASTWAHPGVGLNYAADPGYIGTLDGVRAAAGAGFGYLRGPVPFDDVDPAVAESYGFLATPLPDDPATGSSFRSLVTAPIPGTGTAGSLVGVYVHNGREELVVTFAYNTGQTQFRALAPGIVEWLTRGVHLGLLRYRFSVHVDDVFMPNDRWSSAGDCTPGDDCNPTRDPSVPPYTELIRMTPSDVDALVAWQVRTGFGLQLAYNGLGGVEAGDGDANRDPLSVRFKAVRGQFAWINHTYGHPYLGCVQDFTVVPWRCATDPATGAVRWTPRATIEDQIKRNADWAGKLGLKIDKGELITGEHSGLRSLPQMPTDNPNLVPAINAKDIRALASDASREPEQRIVGKALTVPRHPMNIFYNVATAAEEVDEYNWIYTRRADGGSGICETDPRSTCITPLHPATGYADYIVPLETRIALGHVLAADPRPHYAHQSNLAEDRILYPVLDRVLGEYAALYADNTPLGNPRLREIAEELERTTVFRDAVAAGQVYGYRVGDRVWLVNAGPDRLDLAATLPEGSRFTDAGGKPNSTLFGEPYAGTRSDWRDVDHGRTVYLAVPAGS